MENIQTHSTEAIIVNNEQLDNDNTITSQPNKIAPTQGELNIETTETITTSSSLSSTSALLAKESTNDNDNGTTTSEGAAAAVAAITQDHHDDSRESGSLSNSNYNDNHHSLTSSQTPQQQSQQEKPEQLTDNDLAGRVSATDAPTTTAPATTTIAINSNDSIDSAATVVAASDVDTDEISVNLPAQDVKDGTAAIQRAATPSTRADESISNASTEVHLDASLSERLAGLSISGDETGQARSNNSSGSDISSNDCNPSLSLAKNDDESAANQQANAQELLDESKLADKPAKSAELSRSIMAEEVSDNSECSVEIDDEDEASDYADDKVVSGNVSDEEMFIDDQDEDVEEEEEFHEVEEEKHKTSQESVGNGGDRTTSSPKTKVKSLLVKEENKQVPVAVAGGTDAVALKTEEKVCEDTSATEPTISGEIKSEEKASSPKPRLADWADIMLSSNIQGKELSGDLSEDKLEGEKVGEKYVAKADEQEKVDEAEKKELDLDEDVKNPQYIPKKGVFYEHDDRSHDFNSKKQSTTSSKKDEEAVEVKDSAGSKKAGSAQEKPNENRRGNRRQRTESDRWNHDLFRDDRQKPKSKSELINAYGYDIRQERTPRNHADNRPPRGNNNNNIDRQQQQGSQDNQRSRQNRDNRTLCQGQPANRSRERRLRRQNNNSGNSNNNRSRADTSGSLPKRDVQNIRSIKPDSKDIKHDVSDVKQGFQTTQTQSSVPLRRDHQDGMRDRNTRPDNRGRRQNSKDRPTSNSVDDKLPPITTVMPPITTWSNKIEDMVKEEASRKESSPSRHHHQQQQHPQGINNDTKIRSNDYWPQNQPNKSIYHDRPVRNMDENRQQHYNARRHQDRDDNHKPAQFSNRNHYNDRSNQHHQEWRRTNNYNSSYAKPNEYEPIKTQTFENSRLSQANMNRSNFRDAREIINERRMLQNQQQNFQSKVQQGPSGPEQLQLQQQRQLQHQQHQQHLAQQHQQHQQLLHHQQQLLQHQQPHMRQTQLPPSQQQQQQQPAQGQQAQQHPQQQPPQQASQALQNQRQPQQQQPQTSQPQQHPTQQRQNLVMNNMSDSVQEPGRLSTSASNTSDLINSRPIIKTDAYTGANVSPHSPHSQQPQQLQQHSQNHRSLGGPMSHQGPSLAGSHLVPSHLGAGGTQAQYYTSGSSRDTAALAAYHGYLPSGHSVLDTTRYHMNTQQLSDHGYMTSPGQTNDVAAASVLHQQGMYTDAASASGTVASSAYLAQAGSTLSPSSNIPVTGAGPPPLAPVSYLHQHSQYPPPNPYSNPYSQPQHNQAPPQSSHAYPFWTPYI